MRLKRIYPAGWKVPEWLQSVRPLLESDIFAKPFIKPSIKFGVSVIVVVDTKNDKYIIKPLFKVTKGAVIVIKGGRCCNIFGVKPSGKYGPYLVEMSSVSSNVKSVIMEEQ